MNKLLLKLAIGVTVSSLLSSVPTDAQAQHPQVPAGRLPPAQEPPPAKKAVRVAISQGPALELARDDLAIIRWITNNPGGTDDHFAVVYYGTDREDLSQMAKSHIRLNRTHPETIFRVRMDGLKPQTTYYYKVTSIESDGRNDGVESSINEFTTPGPGERIVASPPQPARSPN
jgi:hypothetical protein